MFGVAGEGARPTHLQAGYSISLFSHVLDTCLHLELIGPFSGIQASCGNCSLTHMFFKLDIDMKI
jgi:hypothetical protein